MERRDWSLKALKELRYVDSLEGEEKIQRLEAWAEKYIPNSSVENFDLSTNDLQALSELFYKNIIFLKTKNLHLQEKLSENSKIKQYFS